MREILFRGKAGAKWVYGDLWHLNDGRATVRKDGELFPYEVIPETVGQYTGLKDKNGKKIFEGDIVKTKKYGKIIGHSNVNDFDLFVVIYEPAMFRLDNTHRAFNLVVKCGKGIDYEVIGNIHDNPELLKGE